MSKLYPNLLTPKRLALGALLSVGTLSAQAQFAYTTLASLAGQGTYVDLAANGTVISTPNTDDANSAATPIGFSFQYNGQTFTDFVLNTNGYLKLGTTAPVAPYFYEGPQSPFKGPLDNSAETNLILPFNLDLEGSTTTEYRVLTSGTAPNRVCTIQWKNVSDKASGNVAKQYSTASFQVKLYETLNRVDFVYGTFTANPGTTDALRTAAVGLKGSGPAAGQTLTVLKTSTAAWTAPTFLAGNYVGDVFNVRSISRPTSGLVYRFNASQPQDASVTVIHTLGKLATPYSLPHTVAAAVQNRGLNSMTNVPVTLTVSGANTFTSTKTVPLLAPGAIATVTFDAYPATLATGTNNLTVAVAADDNNDNNTLRYTQVVTSGNLAYVDDTQPYNATGVGVGSAGGMLATLYTVSQPTYVNEVKATFAPSANNVSSYQLVVLDATGAGGLPGTVLYATPARPRTAAGGSVTLPVPSIRVTGGFYVAVRELTTNPAVAYQVEDPLRSGIFYYQVPGGAWTAITSTTLRTRIAVEATVGTQLSCPIVADASFTNITSTGATIRLTGVPTAGTSYNIIYGPAGFNPASAGTTATGTGPTVALSNLTANTVYEVYVRSNCGATDQSQLVGPFRLTTATVTGSSEALTRAITMFPNPTAGELAIDVRGVTTKGALQVEVLNTLGQRVHTTSIRNNFENKVSLAHLANGMYIVKVLAGDEYMIGNIVVQK
ncbi:T9SS type A sorting domain-containing protein [Hymenobacter sp. HSC-4F20]|uniref:T9SS type A sorting domain-containing protein n=1 Tax=Hymenobacter sp. HSC-4F20 TaxID=2864135 RepID=UPI001C72AEA5|nr:T9SS type A sorting domain-containing protein [Hymenobacter sp. HSC-4F20]MBX0292473.1 T9SS type A sorting domain-containing protein [Hymenobacter sp. HSC-4F20]